MDEREEGHQIGEEEEKGTFDKASKGSGRGQTDGVQPCALFQSNKWITLVQNGSAQSNILSE